MIHGTDSFDIFKALVQILKCKCLEIFGETLIISRATVEKDTEPLKDFFETLGIRVFFEFNDQINYKKCEYNCVLKDYKLWMNLPCETNFSISFDYDRSTSTPCHLE